MKPVDLTVESNGAILTRAALKGTGIFGCLAQWVPCNYAGLFSGTFVMHNRAVALPPATGTYITGSWDMSITVTVVDGVATCDGSQDDVEKEFDNGFMSSESSTKGTILGAVFFAIEFDVSGNYRISAACPTPDLTIASKEYVRNPLVRGGVTVDSSSSTVPGQPANGKEKFFTDPLPAVGFLTAAGYTLKGTQSDPHSNGNGGNGFSTMTWNLKR